MDSATLVGLDIEVGARVVQALDDAALRVKVALWITLAEYEESRLVLASPAFDQKSKLNAYHQVVMVLREVIPAPRPSLLIFHMRDPLIRELRSRYGASESVEGMRFGGETIGGRFILDGFAYRIR